MYMLLLLFGSFQEAAEMPPIILAGEDKLYAHTPGHLPKHPGPDSEMYGAPGANFERGKFVR